MVEKMAQSTIHTHQTPKKNGKRFMLEPENYDTEIGQVVMVEKKISISTKEYSFL